MPAAMGIFTTVAALISITQPGSGNVSGGGAGHRNESGNRGDGMACASEITGTPYYGARIPFRGHRKPPVRAGNGFGGTSVEASGGCGRR